MIQDKAGAPRGPEPKLMPLRRETHASPASYWPIPIALALLLGYAAFLFLTSSGPIVSRKCSSVSEMADRPSTYDPGELQPLMP